MFFAVLIATLALTVGLAIYSLTSRELELSSVGAQSLYAVYAADTGIECALYWDAKYGGSGSAFATSTSVSSAVPAPSGALSCESQDFVPAAQTAGTWPAAASLTAATSTFSIQFKSLPYCAKVSVAKYIDAGNVPRTVILSYGYNTCGVSQTRVERELQASY